jgi:hypothetical protein
MFHFIIFVSSCPSVTITIINLQNIVHATYTRRVVIFTPVMNEKTDLTKLVLTLLNFCLDKIELLPSIFMLCSQHLHCMIEVITMTLW